MVVPILSEYGLKNLSWVSKWEQVFLGVILISFISISFPINYIQYILRLGFGNEIPNIARERENSEIWAIAMKSQLLVIQEEF